MGMKTNLDRNLSFFILGQPRSGTTIIASLFNSLQDAFVLGEPHWYVEAGHPLADVGRDCCGKVEEAWYADDVSDVKRILPDFIKPMVACTDYHLGGYKETWRGDNLGNWLLENHLFPVDFFVIVMRHPIDCHESQMRVNWPADEWTIRRAVDAHYKMLELARYEKSIIIDYESFRADPIGHVNDALDYKFQIEGPLELQPTGWVFGDPKANKSREVV
jgi:hypothetical protein